MKKCTKCERPLQDGEEGLCPSCVSDNNHETKRWIEIAVGTVAVIGSGILWLLNSGKGDGDGTA